MKKGFTLVELVAVVSLLGVLLMFTYTKITDMSEKKQKELLENKKTLVLNGVKELIDTKEIFATYGLSTRFYISLENLERENVIPVDITDLKKEYTHVRVTVGSKRNNYDFLKYELDECPGKNCVYKYETSRKIIGDTISDYKTDPSQIDKDVFLAYKLDSNNKIKTGYACLKNNGEVYCFRSFFGTLVEEVDIFNMDNIVSVFGVDYNSTKDMGCQKTSESLVCKKDGFTLVYSTILDYATVSSGETSTCNSSQNGGIYCD